jgi:hypothetical protein
VARQRLPAAAPARGRTPPAGVPAPARLNRAAAVLALQRAAGNAATRRVLARDPKATTPAPVFQVLIVDDGKTGLKDATLKTALKIVESELKDVTGASTVDAVKAGIDVQVVKSLPKDKPRDIGQRSFIVFLVHGADPSRIWELAAEHIDLDHRDAARKQEEARIKQDLAAEGGVTEQIVSSRRRSESASFVLTDQPLNEEKKQGAGTDSAGNLLADVILHELGHSLGYVKELGLPDDHDKSGIMTKAAVVGSAGAYQARHFSSASKKVILDRLEELAAKPARKRD